MRKAILIATAAALVAMAPKWRLRRRPQMAPQSIPGQRSLNQRRSIGATTTTIPVIAITATVTIRATAPTAITTTIATIRVAIITNATIIGPTTGATGISGSLCARSVRTVRSERSTRARFTAADQV